MLLFRSGAPPMTLLTAGALTDPQLPATASNVYTTDAKLGAPLQTKILATPVVFGLVLWSGLVSGLGGYSIWQM